MCENKKSNYPDTYCNNCKKVTERYSRGNCKECVKQRNFYNNKKRKEVYKEQNRYVNSARKELFNKESYTKFTIENLILDKNNGKQNYIYFLTKGNDVVYIGKSENNFLCRISEHIKHKDFDDVYYKSFSMPNVAEQYEKNFILKYRPKQNKTFAYLDAKVDILDTKTMEVLNISASELAEIAGCTEKSARNLISGNRNKLYNRYILNINRTCIQAHKSILDTHTGEIERHTMITFAEKAGVSQNSVWYFFRGLAKSFQKKRYLIVENNFKSE